MPPATVTLAALGIALSIPLLIGSVSSQRTARGGVFTRRAERGESGQDLAAMILDRGAGERVVAPALSRALRFLRKFTPAGLVETIEKRLDLAGLSIRWSVELILVLKFLTAAAGGVAGYVFSGWPVAAVAFASASVLPDLVLDRLAQARQEKIERELPDALDHITMSVEAGLGFEAAMARAAAAGRGPLALEMRRTLHEMQIGMSRSEALRNLAARTDVLDLRTFVTAVVQSEDYGLPVANVLRIQSAEARTRRRQRAEERALKIPVKMVFPLVLCIFPSLFIVLLGPAAIRISNTLFGSF